MLRTSLAHTIITSTRQQLLSPLLRKTMSTVTRIGTTKRWSDIVIHNNTVYIVEVPSNMDGDITAQTQNLLASVDNLLKQAGTDRTKVLMTTIYLTDFANLEAMNAVWDSWVPEGHAPARACVNAKLTDPRMLVEMAFTAAL